MSLRIGAIITLYVAAGLGLAKYTDEHIPPLTPEQTRAEFARLSTEMDTIALPSRDIYKQSSHKQVRVITAPISPEAQPIKSFEAPAKEANDKRPQDNQLSHQTHALISEMKALNPHHLPHCQRFDYHNRIGYMQSQVWYLDKPVNTPAVMGIESYVYQLTGVPFGIDSIAAIAEAEITEIERELTALESRIINTGMAAGIDEFARLPQFFRTNSDIIQSEYESLLLKATAQLGGEIFDYDPPQAGVAVKNFAHRWNAVASYSGNQMVLYFNEAAYDTKLYRLLAVHEIKPGHHISKYARRNGSICGTDRLRGISLLEEGWATYAEYIADRAGFFDKPDQRLGWLDYRYIRAMRILMDVHASKDGWSNSQLKSLWETRLPPRLHPVFERERERLKRSRHHHLGYIFGRRAIETAHAEIAFEMGRSFDSKLFHDAVLRARYQHMSTFADQVRAIMDARRAPNLETSAAATTG